MNLDKLWDFFVNKGHVIVAALTQGVILYLDRSGHAIGASTQQTVNWFYLFLGGHFIGSQKWPDKDSDGNSSSGSTPTQQ